MVDFVYIDYGQEDGNAIETERWCAYIQDRRYIIRLQPGIMSLALEPQVALLAGPLL